MIDATIQLEGMQAKLAGYITKHGPNARKSIQDLLDRGQISQDNLVPLHDLLFGAGRSGVDCSFGDLMKGVGAVCSTHDNALRQIAERLNVPSAYTIKMANGKDDDNWRTRLISKVLNEHIAHAENEHVLVRRVGDEIRAILSDRYRRMNMPGIFGAFGERVFRHGAMLADGHCGQLRSHLEVLIPKVHAVETKNNGTVYMAFGLYIGSSDYGAGALDVRQFSMSMICTNRMIGKSFMRKVHLGSQLNAQEFAFSEETYRKDYETIKSALMDIVDRSLSPIAIEREIAAMQHDSEVEVNVERRIETLPKLGMTKDESEAIKNLLLGGDPNDGLYGAPTLFKFKQAISAFARVADPDRARELQTIAGNINQ